jgi:hypothetical protein
MTWAFQRCPRSLRPVTSLLPTRREAAPGGNRPPGSCLEGSRPPGLSPGATSTWCGPPRDPHRRPRAERVTHVPASAGRERGLRRAHRRGVDPPPSPADTLGLAARPGRAVARRRRGARLPRQLLLPGTRPAPAQSRGAAQARRHPRGAGRDRPLDRLPGACACSAGAAGCACSAITSRCTRRRAGAGTRSSPGSTSSPAGRPAPSEAPRS